MSPIRDRPPCEHDWEEFQTVSVTLRQFKCAKCYAKATPDQVEQICGSDRVTLVGKGAVKDVFLDSADLIGTPGLTYEKLVMRDVERVINNQDDLLKKHFDGLTDQSISPAGTHDVAYKKELMRDTQRLGDHLGIFKNRFSGDVDRSIREALMPLSAPKTTYFEAAFRGSEDMMKTTVDIPVEEVNKAYAKKHGVPVEEMTENQKKQAFLDAVLKSRKVSK